MGWFTSHKSSKRPVRQTLKPASITSPPNVYYTPSPPPPKQPPRPATANPSHHDWYKPQPPVFSPPGYLTSSTAHLPIIPSPYYSQSPPPPQQQQQQQSKLGRWSEPMVDLARDFVPGQPAAVANATYEDIRNRFDNVMTLIDQESLSGHEKNLFLCQDIPVSQNSLVPYQHDTAASTDRALLRIRPNRKQSSDSQKQKKIPLSQSTHVAASVVKGSYFSKVELYANSKLPMNLPPLRLYMPTWPLLCLAAQYSHRVYNTPSCSERDTHISSSWRSGTKAMRIKSVSMDHASTIVFAIRGTASFSDWAVNLNMAPSPPTNFLDDPGNYCHAGFLSTARKMVKPVAERLRQLLEEDPSRAGHSLLITGHSAGGAVASLLYSHMLSVSSDSESELSILAGCFKRIHCVTFGTPPVSLLPLEKPNRRELKKSVFLTFVNEGDPVVRAEKAYVKSLVELLTAPPPPPSPPKPSDDSKRRKDDKYARLEWKVPPAMLSNPGRIVVLRAGDPHAPVTDYKTVKERLHDGVVAVTCKEEQLRGVVWGDPVAHMMSLYAGRIEILAVGAVTGRRK
ncbi:hypothetical protein QQS21_004846 [Conoideocrella luteorostrata]|uniref:Fungal lipase-type domain-containing protein n=1 Tax=Conoideocrella luteorostrata TaxID=1105319 RepID=A0AAJ0CTI8_9HYPO|nr:hypothetical protein QQS21_004846 [Conoideocrella luteorostrata]